MDKKSPVSVLQELAQLKKLPSPVYSFEEIEGPKFKCTVKVAGKTAVGISTTKRQAKSESAQIAINKLQTEKPSTNYVGELNEYATVKVAGKTAVGISTTKRQAKSESAQIAITKLQTEKPSTNYVGELNEYASKQHLDYPIYECLATTTKSGEYIINCSFLGCEALGKGKSQKEAKQNAARNMVELYLDKGKREVETQKKTNEGDKKKTVKGKNGETGKAEKNTEGDKTKKNIGNSNASKKNSGKSQVDGLGAQDLKKIVATINTLGLNKEGKSGSGSKSSPIQIVINLQK